MDTVQAVADVIQQTSEIKITMTLLIGLMVVVIVVIAYVFVKNSVTQASEGKSQGAILTKQLDLQGKQLDAFNNLAVQVGNLDRTIALQNDKFSVYNNNVQEYLTSITKALDNTLKNSIATFTLLERVEKNGHQMVDELGHARKEVKEAAEKSEAARSGIHALTEIVTTGLTEINTKLEAMTAAVSDLPDIRAKLEDATQSIARLTLAVDLLNSARIQVDTPTPPEGD